MITIARASAVMKMCAIWMLRWWMTWSVEVRVAYIHLKWWKPTWDFLPQLQPAADWLAHQAEAVHTKTVYLGSCALCIYCIATSPLLHYLFFVDVGLMGLHILFNASLGIVEGMGHSSVHKNHFVWQNIINMMIGSEILTHMVLKGKKNGHVMITNALITGGCSKLTMYKMVLWHNTNNWP